jgi:hypothetical protein
MQAHHWRLEKSVHPERHDAAGFEINALLGDRLPVVGCGGVQIFGQFGQIFLGEAEEELESEVISSQEIRVMQ